MLNIECVRNVGTIELIEKEQKKLNNIKNRKKNAVAIKQKNL